MNLGERQVSPTLDGIRKDHKERYIWAAKTMPKGSRVLDVACGVGYGSYILAEAGHFVTAIDRDQEAVDYAREHYQHENISYWCMDADKVGQLSCLDYVVMFEAIEHIEEPIPVLRTLNGIASKLLASVPNETVFPYKNYKYHFQHYTPEQFHLMLTHSGWQAKEWLGQAGTESNVEVDINGRTLIVSAGDSGFSIPPILHATPPTEKHICILGLGPSLESYVDLTKRLGGRSAFCDEVWGINSLGDVIQCDKIFHMDDVRVQELRAKAAPDSNIDFMLRWLKRHPGPIFTSRSHPDYPGLVEFPLEEVLNNLGYGYFNSTAAYAVAYAIHYGATKISLFGCDFSYANSHIAEKGRGCLEFWLGVAAARGIKLAIAERSSLMDTNEPEEQKFYGYDMVNVVIKVDEGAARVEFTPRETIVTAEEIEERYDHSKHPNKLAELAILQEA
jgi:SAM-dependent methyltransferase